MKPGLFLDRLIGDYNLSLFSWIPHILDTPDDILLLRGLFIGKRIIVYRGVCDTIRCFDSRRLFSFIKVQLRQINFIPGNYGCLV